MERNVTVHVTQNNDGSYMVTGSVAQGGSLNTRTFNDTKALRNFLGGDLGIHQDVIKETISALHKGSRSIPNVMLTDEEIKKHGLGPV